MNKMHNLFTNLISPSRIKFSIVSICILLTLPQLKGAGTYQIDDKLFVWAKSGLNIRSSPDLLGKKLGKLKTGAQVTILAIANRTYDITVISPQSKSEIEEENEEIKKTFTLTGNWVEIQSGKFKGYVIDAYLLKLPPPLKKTSIREHIGNLDKAPIKIDTTYSSDCDPTTPIPCYYRAYGKSKEGIVFESNQGESIISSTLTLPNMSIQEGFVFYNFFSPLEDSNRKKSGKEKLKLSQYSQTYLCFGTNELCSTCFQIEEEKLIIRSECTC